MKANIFCWLLLIRSNVLSLKEVLHFRGERNQGPQPENVVKVNTKAVTTDEITACFRLWYRYRPSMQTLLGPDASTINFTFDMDNSRGWVNFGDVLRVFHWFRSKTLTWYSVCFNANIRQSITLVIDGKMIDLEPVKNLKMAPSVQLPSQFNQGLYSIKGEDIQNNFFGKLTDLTLWTDQLTTEQMVTFTSGCESISNREGKLTFFHFIIKTCYLL